MASPHNRILSILDGEAVLQMGLEEATASVELLNADLLCCKNAHAENQRQEHLWEKRCTTLRANLACERLPEITLATPPASFPKDVPGFKAAVKQVHAHLKRETAQTLKPFEMEFGVAECRAELGLLSEFLAQHAQPLREKLQEYGTSNSYHPWFSKKFDQDTAALQRIRQEAPELVAERLASWIKGRRKDHNLPIRAALRKYTYRLKATRSLTHVAEKKLRSAERHLRESGETLAIQQRELTEAIGKFSVFASELDREALLERNEIIHAINRSGASPALRFFHFLELNQLSKERQLFRSAREAQR